MKSIRYLTSLSFDLYVPHDFTLFAVLLCLVAFCAFLSGFYSVYSVVIHCCLPAFFILGETGRVVARVSCYKAHNFFKQCGCPLK